MSEAGETDKSWVFSSGGRGLSHCSVPLVGDDDPPAVYNVRLYFSGDKHDQPGQRVCDVTIQGRKLLRDVDTGATQGGIPQVVREVTGIKVSQTLDIELVAKSGQEDSARLPILNGIDVERVDP